MKNEVVIASIVQLPKITEKIKEIGEELDKRLSDLNLDNLICNENTRKDIKDLKIQLGKELKEFENQRKDIKNKIMAPYEAFNKIYEEEIKKRYQEADNILKIKIDYVEDEIKNRTEQLAREFFDEYKKSKSVIDDSYLKFEELSLKIGLNDLTDKGQLIKKVKDFIIEKVDNVERDINTIRSMDNSGEILVEYLKTKNLSIAIREVNDRHVILEQVQRDYDIEREVKIQEEQAVEKVDEVLQAPVEVQTTIDDFEEPVQTKVELLEAKFKVVTTRENLEYLVKIMKERGIRYEPITE